MRLTGWGIHFACSTAFVFLGCGQAEMGAPDRAVANTSEQASPLSADAPTDWVELTTASSPPALAEHAIAYDAGRKKIVLFGGSKAGAMPSSTVRVDDTWEWDGATWAKMTPATKPSARVYHALAYDGARGKVVLFGGVVSGSFGDDTWEWDGVNWTKKSPASSPPARHLHALAYDSARERVVLFGGSGNGTLGDTWEWDGTTWTKKEPASSPPARRLHALAYDEARQKTVLFGGEPDHMGSPRLSDTWEWDGTTWTKKSPASSPSARTQHALAYDGARKRVVLFGGTIGNYLGDTWEWDGASWTKMAPASSPPARIAHALAYDAARQRILLFGGESRPSEPLNETWSYYRYGSACSDASQCGGAHCVDGVCCDAACTGACEACDVEGSEGVCSPVTGDPHGDRTACATDGTLCGGACDGVKRDECVYPTALCRELSCEDGKERSVAYCDGAGSCEEGTATECGLYVCGVDACLSSCATDDDCVSGAICEGSSCVVPEVDAGPDAPPDADPEDAGDEEPVDAGADDANEVDPVEEEDDAPAEPPSESTFSGGGCHVAGRGARSFDWALLGLGLPLIAWRRRRGTGCPSL